MRPINGEERGINFRPRTDYGDEPAALGNKVVAPGTQPSWQEQGAGMGKRRRKPMDAPEPGVPMIRDGRRREARRAAKAAQPAPTPTPTPAPTPSPSGDPGGGRPRPSYLGPPTQAPGPQPGVPMPPVAAPPAPKVPPAPGPMPPPVPSAVAPGGEFLRRRMRF